MYCLSCNFVWMYVICRLTGVQYPWRENPWLSRIDMGLSLATHCGSTLGNRCVGFSWFLLYPFPVSSSFVDLAPTRFTEPSRGNYSFVMFLARGIILKEME